MDRAALNRIARDIQERWNKPGLAVTVVRQKPCNADGVQHGSDGWEEEILTYGLANTAGKHWDSDVSLMRAEGEEEVDSQTLFSVASTSKHFTTLALGCLIEDGHTLPDGQKLRWGTRVKDVFPQWAPPDETIREQCTLGDLGSRSEMVLARANAEGRYAERDARTRPGHRVGRRA